METATITKTGKYKRLVESSFNISFETTELIDDLVPDEEEALRMKTYIIDYLLKIRELDQYQGYSGNDGDILFHWLNKFIDQIMLDKGLKTIDVKK
jgi:hypothetical protein